MRLIRIQYLLLTTASILFASCEDVVNLPIDSTPELFVFSNFSDQNNLDVYVYKTTSVFSKDTTEYIKDAIVKVYADGELIEELKLVNPPGDAPPFYATSNLSPVFDKEYTIEVKIEGHETITAKNSIPTPVNLEDSSFKPQFSQGTDEDLVVNFATSVSLRDPAGVENFYHIKFYQELIPYFLQTPNDTVFGDTILVYPSIVKKVNENSPANNYSSDQSYLLKDTNFDGQYITVDFTGQYTFNPKQTKAGRFLIELRTVSKAYYLFYTGDEGDVLFNNIDNGVGNFAGFTSKVNSFKLTD
ncbi:MAG: DUF4249 family protein [Bacteroidetes bacterium]|nr:DUF4249 family protein [Bacteroidota bacterium]